MEKDYSAVQGNYQDSESPREGFLSGHGLHSTSRDVKQETAMMEEISLDDMAYREAYLQHRDIMNQERSEEFKKLISESYKKFTVYVNGSIKDGWRSIDHSTPNFKLYELETNDGHYLLKASGWLEVPAWKLIHMNADSNKESRMVWDNEDVGDVTCRGIVPLPGTGKEKSARRHRKKKGTIDRDTRKNDAGVRVEMHDVVQVVESFIKPPTLAFGISVPMVSPRRFLCAQWRRYKPSKREWMMLGITLPLHMRKVTVTNQEGTKYSETKIYPNQHDTYSAAVEVEGFSGLRVIEDAERPRERCFVTQVVYVDPGGYIPMTVVKWYKTRVIDRLKMMEEWCHPIKWGTIPTYPSKPPANTISL